MVIPRYPPKPLVNHPIHHQHGHGGIHPRTHPILAAAPMSQSGEPMAQVQEPISRPSSGVGAPRFRPRWSTCSTSSQVMFTSQVPRLELPREATNRGDGRRGWVEGLQ